MNEETTEAIPDARCPKCKGLLHGRHCLACGWSRKPPQEVENVKPDAHARESIRVANAEAWHELCARYDIKGVAGVWRPTQRVSGVIEGLEHLGSLTCLATDGSRAWYLLPDGQNVLLGHVERFEWKEETKQMISYYDKDERREKFFTLVKQRGCPPTLFPKKEDKVVREAHEKKARARKPKTSPVAQAKALLETLLKGTTK